MYTRMFKFSFTNMHKFIMFSCICLGTVLINSTLNAFSSRVQIKFSTIIFR